jgi:hypothetical protein
MVSLSGNPITRSNSLYVLADFQHNTRIAITGIPGEAWTPAWLTPIYVIVYLGANADGRILILHKHAVARHRRKFKLFQFNLAVVCVD